MRASSSRYLSARLTRPVQPPALPPSASALALPPIARPRACCTPQPSVAARRSFFSLTDITKLTGLTAENKNGSGVETDGEEQRFHARKILPYTPQQLYSLVSDVPRYASFIPFCTSSSVLVPGPWQPDGKPFDVEAELTVGFGGLEERYISRVVGRPYESVTATASEKTGVPLFKSLVTTWSFSPASSLSPHAASALPHSPGPDVRASNAPLPSPSSPSASSASAASSSASAPSSAQAASPTYASVPGPTLLTVDLAFTFANPLHRIASQAVLPKVAEKMVDAFEGRCVEVYGPGQA
ncbi:hypothetical protein Q5752_000751 [Cryptotrichosporon argae]